jgi:hypothetical protein
VLSPKNPNNQISIAELLNNKKNSKYQWVQDQDALKLTNLLLLLHVLARKTKDKDPTIDYGHSHVVISNKYPKKFHQKVVEKQVVEEIMEVKHKRREEKWSERMVNSLITID